MIQTIKSPSNKVFYELINNCYNEIILCAPFVKLNIINQILNIKKETAKVTLITSSSLSIYANGSSDISAIETLLNHNVEVYNY